MRQDVEDDDGGGGGGSGMGNVHNVTGRELWDEKMGNEEEKKWIA